MNRRFVVLILAALLSGCGSGTPNDPTSIESANRILSASGLPPIPDGHDTKIYSWRLMAAGVFARFEHSPEFFGELDGELVEFSPADPMPERIGKLGIAETPWFTPGSLERGRYMIRDLAGDDGTPEEVVVVVDGDQGVVYLAYSWN